MAAGGSKFVIFASMAGNLAIAVTKFTASFVTGSAAMLSEGIHSLVDTSNGVLLLWGLRQSTLPADEQHPFGHGKELYFWTLIVAVMIFALGGGISVYEGVLHVSRAGPLSDPTVNYVVLALAFLFEGAAWWFALREFRRIKGPLGYLEAIRESKDPTTFTVLFEDSAAMLGLMAAGLGIYLSHALNIPQLDGVASIAIGALLCFVAIFLAYESKGLLIGEGVDRRTRAAIRKLVEADPDVFRLVRALSMHFGPSDVLLTLEIEFRPELSAGQAAAAIDRLDKGIRAAHPQIRHLFVEAQSLATRPETMNASPALPRPEGTDRNAAPSNSLSERCT
jgi:cation diffusion facilitator family transporter